MRKFLFLFLVLISSCGGGKEYPKTLVRQIKFEEYKIYHDTGATFEVCDVIVNHEGMRTDGTYIYEFTYTLKLWTIHKVLVTYKKKGKAEVKNMEWKITTEDIDYNF